MKAFNYKKIKSNIYNGDNLEEALPLLIGHAEGQYMQYFLTNILLDYFTLKDIAGEKANKIAIKEDAELGKAIGYLDECLLQADKLFYLKSGPVTRKVTTLKKYREKLEKRVRVLTAYSDKLRINDYRICRIGEPAYDGSMDHESDEDFAGEVINFIFADNESIVINERIKMVYSQLPIRMTKNKFCDVAGKSLDVFRGINEDQLDNYISMLKEGFYPEGVANYGELVPAIYDWIKGFDLIGEDELGRDALVRYENMEVETAKAIDDHTGLYLFVVNLINELIGLLFCINDEAVQLLEGEISQFNSSIKLIVETHKDKKLYYEKAEDMLVHTEGVIEGILENLYSFEEPIQRALGNYKDELKEMDLYKRYSQVAKLPILMSGSHFASLEDKGDELVPQVDALFLGRTKNDLTDYIKGILREDDKKSGRARMANMFLMLNVFHTSPQEVYQFVLDSLTACDSAREKLASKIQIRSFMKAEG